MLCAWIRQFHSGRDREQLNEFDSLALRVACHWRDVEALSRPIFVHRAELWRPHRLVTSPAASAELAARLAQSVGLWEAAAHANPCSLTTWATRTRPTALGAVRCNTRAITGPAPSALAPALAALSRMMPWRASSQAPAFQAEQAPSHARWPGADFSPSWSGPIPRRRVPPEKRRRRAGLAARAGAGQFFDAPAGGGPPRPCRSVP
eukprot:scaffold3836_cov417-Prasinococcus_capsulatus_cf.AAC.1